MPDSSSDRPPAPASPASAAGRPPLLDRSRLLAILEGRFGRRLTLLVAGAGFGKSVLLEQALAAADRDDVLDIPLLCRPGDRFASGFAGALRQAVGARESDHDAAEAIAEAIWRRSPTEVALVLDDVHHLAVGSKGADLLTRLLETLPTNGHLVLASREEPPFPVSRLLALGEAVLIDEARVAFDTSEQQAFASLRGVGPETLLGAGGWPAVIELRTSVGDTRADDFLWEEVIARLGAERVRALSQLSPLASFDDELVREVTGLDCTASELAAGLPLASIDAMGTVRLHQLWKPVLARLEESGDGESRRRAAQVLCARGDLVAAVDLCLDTEDETLLQRLVHEISTSSALGLPQDVLGALLDRIPPDLLGEPAGWLLLGARQLAREPAHARKSLERAEKGFTRIGDARGIEQSLAAQMRLAFWAAEARTLADALERLEAVDSAPRRSLHLQVGRASLALLEGRHLEAIEAVETIRSVSGGGFAVLAGMIVVIAAMNAGLPERALIELDRPTGPVPRTFRRSLAAVRIEARWMLGQLGPEDLDRIATDVDPANDGGRHNLTINTAVLAQMNAALGRLVEGRRLLAKAEVLARLLEGPRPAVACALASAAIALHEGDEAGAATTLRALLAEHPFGERPLRPYLRGLPIFYLLLPEQREAIEQLAPESGFERAVSVARAVVALREHGDRTLAAAIDWSQPRAIAAPLIAPLAIELAVAALTEGVREARAAIETLAPDPRPALRSIADRYDGPVAGTARALLASWPVPPEHPVRIRVLGPLAVLHESDPPVLITPRRERVRALLLYLVDHPVTTREAIGAALWPELDEESVANNLRVTLNHLHRVLEPGREAGEPAWFVRAEGGQLSLVRDERLRVDAWELERISDAARHAERQGATRRALGLYLETVEQWGGEYLADAPDPAWGESERTRLRSRFVRSAVRAGELLLAQDQAERALELARRAASADEFNEAPERLIALAYHGLQDRAAARRSLAGFLARLEGEGLTPEPKTRRLATRLGLV